MINLRNRTEYSFHTAVGRLPLVLSLQTAKVAGIVDRHGTWGHVRWAKECKAAGIKPLFGVELAVVPDAEARDRVPANYMSFIAINQSGLKELYELVGEATRHCYYNPRIDYNILNKVSENIAVLSGPTPLWDEIGRDILVELNPLSSPLCVGVAKAHGYRTIATNDNIYPAYSDLAMYQIVMENKAEMSTVPRHLLSELEWHSVMMEGKGFTAKERKAALKTAELLARECDAQLPEAEMVKPKRAKTLLTLCIEGAKKRGLKLDTDTYQKRLRRELDLIEEKKFEDYFYVVKDMIDYAKTKMFVGPARGSSCGSLVCYLLGITDIDPIPFGLLFERFIDANREDLPDIDIDFQDDRRELVFEYLREKYGHENVGRLGNVNVFKAKSALTQVAKQLRIPLWEITELKDSMLERSTGDARAQFCIADTFEQLDIGKKVIEKYPELMISGELEGHASHSGMHAAGIVITANALTNYCSINHKTGTAMIDLKDAAAMNLLKIDALGLRTLAVLQDTCDQVGWNREKLVTWPRNDKKAFALLNDQKFSGIFQFEGYALQSVAKQMSADGQGGIRDFEDIAHATALARPGPFNSGATTEFLERRAGRSETRYLHKLTEEITKVTNGVIIYQEQVMQIARVVGALSWEDVSELRRAMSKSLGEEYFNIFWLKFYKGAAGKHNLSHAKAEEIWKQINTMGSWAFNRSHAVAYGTISYWCCVMKAYHPLEFAAACLRNSKDDDQSIKILRELVREGYEYVKFDPFLSEANWSVKEGRLIGGLTGIKQVGEKVAAEMLRKRATHNTDHGVPFSPREVKLLNFGVTPWDSIFEADDLWRHVYKNPTAYDINRPLLTLEQVSKLPPKELDGRPEDSYVVFLGKLKSKNQRDHNEIKNVARRGGKLMNGQTLYLHVTVDDDTENNRLLTIGRNLYLKYGKPIIEVGRIGDWYLWLCSRDGDRLLVVRCERMTGNPRFTTKISKSRKA